MVDVGLGLGGLDSAASGTPHTETQPRRIPKFERTAANARKGRHACLVRHGHGVDEALLRMLR